MDQNERNARIGKLARVMSKTMHPLFRRIGRKNEILYGSEMTLSKISILITLRNEGPLPPSVIADKHCYSRQNLTTITDGLESEGLITRSTNPSDRRSTILEITEPGKEYIRVTGERLKRLLIQEFDSLDDRDIEALGDAFDTIERVFEKISTNQQRER